MCVLTVGGLFKNQNKHKTQDPTAKEAHSPLQIMPSHLISFQ